MWCVKVPPGKEAVPIGSIVVPFWDAYLESYKEPMGIWNLGFRPPEKECHTALIHRAGLVHFLKWAATLARKLHMPSRNEKLLVRMTTEGS